MAIGKLSNHFSRLGKTLQLIPGKGRAHFSMSAVTHSRLRSQLLDYVCGISDSTSVVVSEDLAPPPMRCLYKLPNSDAPAAEVLLRYGTPADCIAGHRNQILGSPHFAQGTVR